MPQAVDPRSGSSTEGLPAFRLKWLEANARSGHGASDSYLSPLYPIDPRLSARSGLSLGQMAGLFIIGASLIYWTMHAPADLYRTLFFVLWLCFVLTAALRLFCSLTPPVPQITDAALIRKPEDLPTYSVIVALYRETNVIRQLLAALHTLDYPPEQLDIILALEADDHETLEAIRAFGLPGHMRVIIVPEGTPRTKPRALNYALEFARGEYLVIYDAEDIPHPEQLREAATLFSKSDPAVVCLQAPLRPLGDDRFISRQFCAEYAVQFDVVLPTFCALGLPMPLGGTSNHFRSDVLKSIGGWDAWNVTEDADLGMRLGRLGFESAMISRPTYESAPTTTESWIPQRTRWIKGYIQTLFVHTRHLRIPLRLWLSLGLGVGLSALTALAYAPFTLMVTAQVLMSTLSDKPLTSSYLDLGLFVSSMIISMLALKEGTKRSLTAFELKDMLMAPLYWGLTSISAAFAVYQLLTRPFHWDKTEHHPIDAEAMESK